MCVRIVLLKTSLKHLHVIVMQASAYSVERFSTDLQSQ